MKIINVIPLSKGIFKETLSYFSSQDIKAGNIVTVEVRKKKIDALVESTKEVRDIRTKIRTSPYTIKKLEKTEAKFFFTTEFVLAAQDCAKYFATTTGEIIQSLTPKVIIDEQISIKKNEQKQKRAKKEKNEIFIYQASDEDRIATYKSLIREEFAKGLSVLLCLPSSLDTEIILNALERGIKEYTFILHGNLSKNKLIQSWENITNEKHPVLIVSTGHFLSIPRKDIGTIILDKENSQNYKTFLRPYFDIRTFVEIFAKTANLKLIFGDTLLRTETIWRADNGDFVELSPSKFRSLSTATQSIIDMKEYKTSGCHKSFSIISNELKSLIEETKNKNETLFLLVGRRGLSTVTVCNDCGELVQCKKCKTPMVLHKKNKENIFLCHKCGEQEDSERVCHNCSSWRLTALGGGVEKIEDEISKFNNIKIFRIDSDSTKSNKEAIKISEKFFSSPGSVLIGTEMSIPYISKHVDSSAILGIDSLFALPDFRMNEKIFNLLLSVRAKTLKNFLIQTQNTDNKIFEYATKGNLLDFYREEIKQREKFGYPPFSILLKITYQNKKSVAIKEIEKLSETLNKYNPSIYPSFNTEARGRYSMNILIKLPLGKWVDLELLEILRTLPPTFTIKIDPGDLL